ncbi:oligosaccharide flippase family protein [Candidatus Roizmanbacteria bacterium]|nr:oligosaccharide flippase family protein [Candidatus Roizmanbacteria bacterium]
MEKTTQTSSSISYFATLKKRSVKGVVALISRSALQSLISFIGLFFLTFFLLPETFGVFYVVSAAVAFLNYFSDIGLGAALIQKKEEITREDLVTTFTIQQLVVLTLSLVALLLSGYIASFYRLSAPGTLLFQALVVSFFLSSLKTIPSILLERKLAFDRLVIPQILEVLVFYGVAVYGAWKGWELASFTYAVIFRGIVGLVSLYMIEPWMPSVSLHMNSAKQLLSFGVPFQLNSILALIKDDLFTLYLGRVLPFAQVGYIGWAKRWSEAPLRLIMDNVVRVTFPTYSRLQAHPEKLEKAINKAIFFLMLFIIPLSIGMLFLVNPFIELIPRYEKWLPAIPSFYLFVIASAIAGLSTPLINALNAIGKIGISLRFMVFWTAFIWIVTPLVIPFFGFHAVAGVAALMSTAIVAVIAVSRKYVRFSLKEQCLPAALASLPMGAFLYWAQGIFPPSIFSLILLILCGSFIYCMILLLFFRKKVMDEVNEIIRILQDKT